MLKKHLELKATENEQLKTKLAQRESQSAFAT
jgi:hypothetical protein